MTFATEPGPDWTHEQRTRIDDSRRDGLTSIDLSIVGPYRLSKFRQLVNEWRVETAYLSSAKQKMDHPAFKSIVEMDEWAVGWIIEELKTKRDFLFMALHLITKIDPSPPSAKGKPHEIIEAWLQWAERENIKAE